MSDVEAVSGERWVSWLLARLAYCRECGRSDLTEGEWTFGHDCDGGAW